MPGITTAREMKEKRGETEGGQEEIRKGENRGREQRERGMSARYHLHPKVGYVTGCRIVVTASDVD